MPDDRELTMTDASIATLCAMLGAMALAIEQWTLLATAMEVPAEKIDAAKAIAAAMDTWCGEHGR